MGVFNKTVIPLALVGYEMIIANRRYAPRWLSIISYPTRSRGIIVKYVITPQKFLMGDRDNKFQKCKISQNEILRMKF